MLGLCIHAQASKDVNNIFNDPMRPIYVLDKSYGDEKDILDLEKKDESLKIPAIDQLVVGKQRKIVIMGGKIYREGDVAQFGKIAQINQNEVILEINDTQKTIQFRDKDQRVATYKK